ncbi:MAG: L-histidine N(alpha)-methyltransferase [Acidimicrobiia bacterium]
MTMSRLGSTGVDPSFDVHLDEGWRARSLAHEVTAGLTARPKRLSPRWLYDDRGRELFDRITRLPEYYPTEAEREILLRHADEIAQATDADTLVELGSGTSDKTRALLDAFAATGQLRRFVPFDVSEQTLRDAAIALAERYPSLAVHGVVGDFHEHLEAVPRDGVPVLAFLGSTIGNFYPDERSRFLADVAKWMTRSSSFLLGVDLVKPVDRIMAAYNDPSGVTAEFTLNLLRVLNRELDADFDLDGFEHVGLWDPAHTRVDLRLRSLRSQTVQVRGVDLTVTFGEDEELRAEISTKFTLDQVAAELAEAGMAVVRTWTDDDDEDVAVVLARLAP